MVLVVLVVLLSRDKRTSINDRTNRMCPQNVGLSQRVTDHPWLDDMSSHPSLEALGR
jgi:hypothetical protein